MALETNEHILATQRQDDAYPQVWRGLIDIDLEDEMMELLECEELGLRYRFWLEWRSSLAEGEAK